MEYELPLHQGYFLRRYKRFFVDIETETGESLTVYCPNTGSLLGCLEPGNPVRYLIHGDPKKKLPGNLEQIQVKQGNTLSWVGVNTQRANKVAHEAILNGDIDLLREYTDCSAEVPYGVEKSRIDFLLSAPNKPANYVEVKSVTYGAGKGIGYFPDAKTLRGTKHLRELAHQCSQGNNGVLLYCVQHTGITEVRPAVHIDPDYAVAVASAKHAGVEFLAFRVLLSSTSILFDEMIPVRVPESEFVN